MKSRCLIPAVIFSLFLFLSWSAAGACLEAPSGILAWWQADNSALDSIGTNNGNLYGSTTYSNGIAGKAFAFDGLASSITNGLAGYTNALDTYTMEFWAYPTAGRTSTTESVSGEQGRSGQRYAIYPNHGGVGPLAGPNVGAGVSVGTNGVSVFEHGGNYLPSLLVYDAPVSGWTHIAVVYNARQPSLYVNGVLVRTGLTSQLSSYPSTWLGEAGPISGGYGYYKGLLDEVAVYNRALDNSEIYSIYAAGASGKCPAPPTITSNPADVTAPIGGSASFVAEATGSPPLSFAWQFQGTNIPGATSNRLDLQFLQAQQGGYYYFVASNTAGVVTSAPAYLSLFTPPSCAPIPTNAISWWKGEGDLVDSYGTNHGTAASGLSFAPGEVGNAFVFDGLGSVIQLGNPASMRVQNLTVETWIRRSSDTVLSLNSVNGNAHFFGYGFGGYTVFLDANGHLAIGHSGIDDVRSQFSITDTNLHHVAVSKSGTNVTFYIDGNAESSVGYNTSFTFANNAYIGSMNGGYTFYGQLDDLAVFGRALNDQEVAAIYTAGISGICAIPLTITAALPNQNAYVGSPATFNASVAGSRPIAFQWQLGGTNIPGATDMTYALSSVQFSNAGSYRYIAQNLANTLTSAPALLNVLPVPPCQAPPSNIISFWKADGNFLDNSGGNNGNNSGNSVAFGPGIAGSGFTFNGSGSVVTLGSPVNLRFQDLTIEAWVRRSSSSLVTLTGLGNGHLFTFDSGGYTLFFDSVGRLALGRTGTTDVRTTVTVTDTNFHHVAVTKTGTNVVFYVDGVPVTTTNFSGTFAYGSPAYIGGIGNSYSFYGMIDELGIFNRGLSAQEIQSIYNAAAGGLCNVPAALAFQPQSVIARVGSNVTFMAGPIGTPPLTYGWRFNGTAIAGATNTSLTVTNAQANNSGGYSFGVTNALGTALSTNAILRVQFLFAFANGQLVTNSSLGFAGAVTIQLTNSYTNGVMFYTLDGSTPTFFSTQYTGPFVVSNTSLLRVLGYSSDFFQSGEMDPVFLNVVPSYSVTATSPGGGTVNLSPTGGAYLSNSTVTLTAVPTAGWTFLQWLGDASGSSASTSIVVNTNNKVQALFGTTLSTTVAGSGSVVMSPSASLYPYGSTVALTAVPQSGSYFAIWGNAGSGNVNPLYFKVTNANQTISSLFSTLSAGQYALTVIPNGFGRVNVTPRANVYTSGANVSLSAVPDNGQSFSSWSGDASGTGVSINVTMNQSRMITANFSKYPLLSITNDLDGMSEKGLRLTVAGDFGTIYRVDFSSNLVGWNALGLLANTYGTGQITDSVFTNKGTSRFYRAVSQ